MPRCCIGLGGNLGDVAAAFSTALQELHWSQCSVVSVSRLYVTRAVGPHADNDFHNACAVIDTEVAPHDLLNGVHGIEDAAGRTRSIRWGPRPIDIDLLTYGDLVLQDPRLLAPEYTHPSLQRSVAELQRRLRLRPLRVMLWGGTDSERNGVESTLLDRFDGMIQLDAGMATSSGLEQTLIDLAPEGPSAQRPPSGTVVVSLDPKLLHNNPTEAAVAVVTAMLDEPTPVGEIRLPDC
jgi:2-amino-4-hydroxy-6-hydroxymethyldihydropteridine diphosphokinase